MACGGTGLTLPVMNTIRATITNPLSCLAGLSFDFVSPVRQGDAFKVTGSESGHFDGLCYFAADLAFAPVIPAPMPSRVSPLEANFGGRTPVPFVPSRFPTRGLPSCAPRVSVFRYRD